MELANSKVKFLALAVIFPVMFVTLITITQAEYLPFTDVYKLLFNIQFYIAHLEIYINKHLVEFMLFLNK